MDDDRDRDADDRCPGDLCDLGLGEVVGLGDDRDVVERGDAADAEEPQVQPPADAQDAAAGDCEDQGWAQENNDQRGKEPSGDSGHAKAGGCEHRSGQQEHGEFEEASGGFGAVVDAGVDFVPELVAAERDAGREHGE